MEEGKDLYDRWKRLTEESLTVYLPRVAEESGRLYEAMEYSLTAGGKRLRPVLLLAACSLCGGEAERALPYACAVEFIHTYSLIHDDHPSMDNDDYRRGKLTNHKVYGDGMAILAGDGLLNSAFDVMLEDLTAAAERGEDTAPLIRAVREISVAAGVRGMIAGQAADVENDRERRQARGEENSLSGAAAENMLLYIHRNKTGAMIRGAVRAGACIGGASPKQLNLLTEYAENLGLAFQITDDILDVVGDSAALGKATGADELLGKLTYPSVYGLEVSREKLKAATDRAVSALTGFGPEGGFLAKLAIDLQNRIA